MLDTSTDIRPGTKVDGMVCSALISRDGSVHYADDWGHDDCASMLGYYDKEEALRAGFLLVSVTGQGHIAVKGYASDAQAQALWNMMGVAQQHTTRRCEAFLTALRFFVDEQGLA